MDDIEFSCKLEHKKKYSFLVSDPPEERQSRLQGINFALQPGGKTDAIALVCVGNHTVILNHAMSSFLNIKKDDLYWHVTGTILGQKVFHRGFPRCLQPRLN